LTRQSIPFSNKLLEKLSARADDGYVSQARV
jgi:hypothetical protein